MAEATNRTSPPAARVGPRLEEMSVLGPAGFFRLAYAEWGPADAEHVVLCVHGVSRNSRDFDALAGVLAARGVRVVAPDLPGRGRSDWLASGEHYDNHTYLPAMAALIARLGANAIDWVGTSLGGHIGMAMAALPHNPIRRMVLNDFGARVSHTALSRIATYLRVSPRFADLAAAEDYLRTVLAPFGRLTDAQWRHLTVHSVLKDDAGVLRWSYDPSIARNFSMVMAFDVILWHIWEEITCPVLIMRGENSDLLTRSTMDAMLRRGPAAAAGKVSSVEWPDCGHAPALMASEQIARVRDFLLQR